jgi:hypothetical protein
MEKFILREGGGRHAKKVIQARCWWLTPVILAIREAEIKRIVVRSQPG